MSLRRFGKFIRSKYREWSPAYHSIIQERDVFLVSYPRSGNTWARFLLSNVVKYSTGDEIDFHTVHRVIPDYEIPEHRDLIRALPEPRIIKSHALYTPRYPRVIYLIRDGRDVAVSYFDYLSKQGRFDATFADLLLSDDLPYGTWDKHVRSWLKSGHEIDLVTIRYEDLLQDTWQELGRMVEFIGLPVTPEQLEHAVEASAFGQMRKIEETRGRPYGDAKYQFVRRGTAGQWQGHFDDNNRMLFKSTANDLLNEFGYADTPDW